MTELEIIDRLCEVSNSLLDIVKRQQLFIAEQIAVDDAIKEEFRTERESAEKELDRIEYGLRPHIQ